MKPWLLFFIFLFFLPVNPVYATEEGYAETLVREALSRRLYETPDWRVLLHYKPDIFGGPESLIDDPRFFNSPDGKTDPEKELSETIRAFFRTDVTGDEHPQCRFVGRFEWLKGELGINEELLPKTECPGYRELYDHLRPESAVLIFPVSHMNSPASMFGHTLLRIDSDSKSKLLSYAVNYSAFTGETNGLLFAVRGIFGYYKGYFSVLPYYEKIKEYSDIDNRDIWEYRLDFKKEEVERLVRHLWELKDIYSYYYFFDENCSYNLLLALEAARPGSEIAESLPAWTIPMDTIKAVRDKRIYTLEPSYRPSRATGIRFVEGLTDNGYQEMAKDVSYGGREPEEILKADFKKDDKVKTLDLAGDYLQYIYAKKKVAKDEYIKRNLKILGARSRLGKSPDLEVPVPSPPDKGHGSGRVALGVGSKAGSSYNFIRLRPANHDLLDPDEGYLQGAAITFLDTELRYNHTEDKFSLEALTFVEIVSIAERDNFFKPVSWKVNFGVAREEYGKRRHRTAFRLNGGPGLSYRLFSNGLLYGFLEPELKVSNSLEDGYALGAGVFAGILKPVTDDWKIQIEFGARSFELGERHRIISAEVNQSYRIGRDDAIKLNLKREYFEGFYSTDVNLSWNRYF